jgi:hypothetical protein
MTRTTYIDRFDKNVGNMDPEKFYCPKCHTTEEHDHESCDGKPDLITTRWYTYEELTELMKKRKKKVYYVKSTRPNTR